MLPAGVSSADFYYILPEIVLTVGALVVLIADVLLPRGSRALVWVAVAALTATLVSLAPFANIEPVEVANGLIAVDSFALFFKGLFLVAAIITVLMSVRYLEIEGASPGEYYFLILCATLGMMIMAGGIDLITSFVGLETMAVSFYILVGFIKPNQRSNEAAVKYFLLGAFSLGILLYGMSLLYGVSGTTSLRGMAMVLGGQARDPLLVLAVILVVAGLGFKIAAVPFHMWAPDVYEGAPTPVTAFLSVGSKAASFAMLLRILFEGLPSMSADWRLLFEVLAIVTMTVGNLSALTQSNLKRMLAYSSIAHAGYLMMGVVAATSRGVSAMLIYLFVYAFHAAWRVCGDRDDASPRCHRRRVEGPERIARSASLCGVCPARVHVVARRNPTDCGVHGQAVVVWCRHRCRLRLAGRHRGVKQRRFALLLRAGRRVHVPEDRRDRVGADCWTGARLHAGARPCGDDPVRPLSPCAIRPRRNLRSVAPYWQYRGSDSVAG